jgi:hypothetical protein
MVEEASRGIHHCKASPERGAVSAHGAISGFSVVSVVSAALSLACGGENALHVRHIDLRAVTRGDDVREDLARFALEL